MAVLGRLANGEAEARPSPSGPPPPGILARVSYEVRTDVFDGPFDVLLRLISEQQVDLYQVRLSDIVDAYIAEIDKMDRLDLEVATEFLLIAAILVELKTRRLLPDRSDSISDDDLALLEERDYLLARLVECTTFSGAGQKLADLERVASRSFPRIAGPDDRFEDLAPDLLAGVTPDDLRRAAERALAERPVPQVQVDHILVDEVTVAEVVERLAAMLPGQPPTTFRELTRHARHASEIVVHFLGILELYKQGLVDLDQVETFGELTVTWIGVEGETPDRYDLHAALVDAEYRG
jgi:segregation and condensation protein A